MATVVFSNAQRHLVGGDAKVEIEAARVAELIAALYARYPKLDGLLDDAAVAIDGDIHNHGKFLRLQPDSEVHFLGQVAGGSGACPGHRSGSRPDSHHDSHPGSHPNPHPGSRPSARAGQRR